MDVTLLEVEIKTFTSIILEMFFDISYSYIHSINIS